MVDITVEGLSKTYDGSIKAVDSIDLEINHGDFFTLVGPSGCGKTTTLRMIAGLETPSEGDIYFDGEKVTDLTPQQRDIAMVFQNIALFPHMSCYDNISFGLRVRGETENLDEKVRETAEMLNISDQLEKKPDQLSGGQQQRVALGRAIVRRPNAILLDEPMSDLDAKLKSELRVVVQELHQEIDTTMIYVTHDQEEAMTMSTRIGLMNGGRLEQVDEPEQLYDSPISEFSATFIGQPSMNMIDARVDEGDLVIKEETDSPQRIPLNVELEGIDSDRKLHLGFRPQHASLTKDVERSILPLTFSLSEPNGDTYNVYLEDPTGDQVTIVTGNVPDVSPGDSVGIDHFDKLYLFDAESGAKLHRLDSSAFESRFNSDVPNPK